jgi:hypothetical protein
MYITKLDITLYRYIEVFLVQVSTFCLYHHDVPLIGMNLKWPTWLIMPIAHNNVLWFSIKFIGKMMGCFGGYFGNGDIHLFFILFGNCHYNYDKKIYWDFFGLISNVLLGAYVIVKTPDTRPFIYCMRFTYVYSNYSTYI